jgi:thiamine monophosphate synthase
MFTAVVDEDRVVSLRIARGAGDVWKVSLHLPGEELQRLREDGWLEVVVDDADDVAIEVEFDELHVNPGKHPVRQLRINR